jgi:hypothetical protein
MKIMFMDESGDHQLEIIDKQYPIFCLAGAIIDEQDYSRTVKPHMDKIKLDFFKTTSVILRSHSIRKCINEFNILLNAKTRTSFYEAINNFISNIPLTVLASVILKNRLKSKYVDPSNPYEVSMVFLMERFLYFLEDEDDSGYITVEARDPKSNSDLFQVYSNILANGSKFASSVRFKSRITKIEFITKKQNENGHQLADLLAYPIANKVLYPKRLNLAFEIIKSKLRRKGNKILGCGLKIFP